MGLAASQGRMLSLTARNHDLVYEAQQISQQRLFLADTAKLASDKYNDAMNNTKLQATVNGETQPLTYDVLTSQDPFSGLCMRLVDNKGNVVIPAECIEVQQTISNDETGATTKIVLGKYTSSSDFINAYMKDLSDEQKSELSTYSLSNIYNYYNENYSNKEENSNITVIHRNKDTSKLLKDGEKTLVDVNIYDPEYLQKMLTLGEFKIQQAQSDGTYDDLVWQGSSVISEVYDTSDDSAAEAAYEASTSEFQRKDKILELRLKQVETQQNAVRTELETIKKIIDGNVEKSFSTFKG